MHGLDPPVSGLNPKVREGRRGEDTRRGQEMSLN